MPSRRYAVMLSGVAAMALAGCREDVARTPEPLFVPAATAEAYGLPLAPEFEALPPAPPAPVQMAAYQPDYGYAERAYAMDQAFYEAPPDYGFSYVDAQPWAWRSHDGYEMFVEPIDDGYRYYYYEPGAEYPFFVRAPDYGYGYGEGGVLTVVYSTAGAILPYGYLDDQAPRAGRYWARAHSLRSAARHRPAPVVYDAWLLRRPTFVASQSPWMQAAVREDKWRRHRDRQEAKEIRKFERERERRADALARMERDEVRQALRRQESDDGRRLVAFDRDRRERADRRAERDARLPERVAVAQADRREDRERRADRRDEPRREHIARRDTREDRPDRAERRNEGRVERREAERAERKSQATRQADQRREARVERLERRRADERAREPGQRMARVDREERRPIKVEERAGRGNREPQARNVRERPTRKEQSAAEPRKAAQPDRQHSRADRGRGNPEAGRSGKDH